MLHDQKDVRPSVVLSHGGVQYSYQMAFALQQAGFLKAFWTTFYSFNGRRGNPFLRRYLSRRHYEGLKKELIYSNSWPEIFQRVFALLLGRNYFTVAHLVHLRNRIFDFHVSRRLGKMDFDLFIGLSGSALYSIEKARRLGKVTVVDQHDIHYSLAAELLETERKLHPEFASSMPYWPPLKRYLECVEKELELSDFILVPSSFSLKSHLDAGIPKEKLIVLLHGLNPPTEESVPLPRENNGIFRVLFVGTLTQRKGIKYLLEAVKQLRLPKLELTLIGDQMADRQALVPYRDYFQHINYLPYEKLKVYLRNAHLLVLPSIYDAFGLVALDGMAAGLPVIVSENTAAGSDVVRDGVDGFVIPIRDVEALKDRILRLYQDSALRSEMGENAAERVRQFSWEVYENRLKEAIEWIMESKKIGVGHAS